MVSNNLSVCLSITKFDLTGKNGMAEIFLGHLCQLAMISLHRMADNVGSAIGLAGAAILK